ncbi:MAG: orotidine-5'-phosphate decarboxylase [Halofilum sp. (in: g-proteobacteria)]|nr:orotidine-5'-phosphate decarboxylase [Halofilum sp. (in: g-proteobacteria)]
MTINDGPRLVIALDYADIESADRLVRQLDPALCRLKVGKELFTRTGPACIETWQARGFEVFLDLKFHDIPNTVAAACRAAADLAVWMVNVHALGGRRMLEAACEALDAQEPRPLLVAVTVLTSLGDSDLHELGIDASAGQLADRLAGLAQESGCDGVVCSAREAATMRARFGHDFLLVTPGIRAPESPGDDQHRTMTPVEAIRAGASHLVVGRPVTRADDPARALRELAETIAHG